MYVCVCMYVCMNAYTSNLSKYTNIVFIMANFISFCVYVLVCVYTQLTYVHLSCHIYSVCTLYMSKNINTTLYILWYMSCPKNIKTTRRYTHCKVCDTELFLTAVDNACRWGQDIYQRI